MSASRKSRSLRWVSNLLPLSWSQRLTAPRHRCCGSGALVSAPLRCCWLRVSRRFGAPGEWGSGDQWCEPYGKNGWKLPMYRWLILQKLCFSELCQIIRKNYGLSMVCLPCISDVLLANQVLFNSNVKLPEELWFFHMYKTCSLNYAWSS